MRRGDRACLAAASCLTIACRATCVDTEETRRMFDAVWRNDVAEVRNLLDRDASLVGASACAPLLSTTRSVATARLSGLSTPLLAAARNGHHEIVTLLLAHGAPPDSSDTQGETALYLAAEYGHDEVVAALLAAHAAVDGRAKGSFTPLDAAAGNGHVPVVKRLIAAGADVNARQLLGYTPLHSAADEGRADVARLLIEHGAIVDLPTDDGATALHGAAIHSHDGVVRVLTANGADVNRKSKTTTALILALTSSEPDTVRTLIEAGANVNQQDPRGHSPLDAVIVERMRSDPFDERQRAADRQKMRLLIAAGADITVRGKTGATLLHTAAARDRDDLAEVLIESGADVDARDAARWTPLHVAAERRHSAVAELLLDNGADVNARAGGRTPLNLVWGDPALRLLLQRHGGREVGELQ
jgi:ankyrin repeat protein